MVKMNTLLSLCLAALAPVVLAQTRPTVDLGYEIHTGTVNATGNFYEFSNIPYAQQPIGDLRFQKPVAPNLTSTAINNGSTDYICFQAYPSAFVALIAAGDGLDEATTAYLLDNQAGQTESCLVLDVYVPEGVFANATTLADAPVLVWIHGGGFTFGSKTSTGSPAGIIARSELSGESAVIFVSINYRLGLFGWLAGNDITPNLGFYDQRLALEWVQNYICLFGGNPDKVTVMGESAGASSILMQITAYGGSVAAPFQSAIPQSPAFQININYTATYDLTMETASNQTGVSISSIISLTTLDSETLKSINQAVVYQALYGQFNFGPIVDGTFVPKLPQVLLLDGSFDHSINVMTSHMSNESVQFTPTDVNSAAGVEAYFQSTYPKASNETVQYVVTELYPDVLDGSYPWQTEFARLVQINSDINFACSTRYLATALCNATHNYIFAYPPGYHSEDVPYVFFNGDTSTSNYGLPVDPALAYALQDYIVAFARTGTPSAEGLPDFPEYGDEAAVLEFTYAGVVKGVDDMASGRCDWIQQAMAQGLLL